MENNGKTHAYANFRKYSKGKLEITSVNLIQYIICFNSVIQIIFYRFQMELSNLLNGNKFCKWQLERHFEGNKAHSYRGIHEMNYLCYDELLLQLKVPSNKAR